MRSSLIALSFVVLQFASNAQDLLANAQQTMTLKIKATSGTNGLAVTYNKKAKLYYTAFAGNKAFPLEIFTTTGEFVSTQEAGFDMRGLWYNKKVKGLEGVSYPDSDSFKIGLTKSGYIGQGANEGRSYDVETNAVAVFHEKGKKVLFLTSEGMVHLYKPGTMVSTTVKLALTDSRGYNFRAPVYTNVKGKELGVFNYETLSLDLFDLKTGNKTGSVKFNLLAANSDFEVLSNFRLSYANNLVWVYDADARTWHGYNIWD